LVCYFASPADALGGFLPLGQTGSGTRDGQNKEERRPFKKAMFFSQMMRKREYKNVHQQKTPESSARSADDPDPKGQRI
jgi:hypothetical protein